ncbi:MAG: hypothetical protein HC819_11845 [Cyclobacteriaceae bacterium]|nr:hypothetical protein [Cyclobacteriaceae bacterium]
MSEHITHIAIYEDTIRLISHSDEFHQAFKVSLQNQPDAGLMSAGARGNHLHAVPFLEQTRDIWSQRKPGDGTEEKIAAAIGWLSHRAIDLKVKSIQLKDGEITDVAISKDENDIYQDAVTFDKVYGRGKKHSHSSKVHLSEATLAYSMSGHPAAQLLHTDQIEALVVSMVQQNLMSYHQFHANTKDPEAWLNEYPDHYQKLSEDLNTYIEAFTHPDPLKMKVYIEDFNFYNEQDELLLLVRELQNEGNTKIDLQNALQKAENESQYAQGLRRSYLFNKWASDFFQKEMDKNTLYDKLENLHEPFRL